MLDTARLPPMLALILSLSLTHHRALTVVKLYVLGFASDSVYAEIVLAVFFIVIFSSFWHVAHLKDSRSYDRYLNLSRQASSS